jgi:hypothetical protein
MDFSKRSFSDAAEYASGFLTVDCNGSGWGIEKITMSSVVADLDTIKVDQREIAPVVVATRDDCGNVWHALTDFLRLFVSLLVTDTQTTDAKVLVMDDRLMVTQDPDDVTQCPYHGSLDALGRRGVARGLEYRNKVVYFDRVILNHDSTGLLTLIWDMKACDTGPLVHRYVSNLFDAIGLPNRVADVGKKLHLVVSSRRKKPFAPKDAPIGRVITYVPCTRIDVQKRGGNGECD